MTIKEAKEKLVATARGELGYREGSNNYNKFAADPMITKLYGWTPQNQPWCAVFVNWVFLSTFGYDIGSRLTYGGSAACNNAALNYKNKDAFVHWPEVGDQSFYYSSGAINHTGVVVAIDGSTFTAIEGNYSDKVSSVRHNIGDANVAGFGRPKWSLVETIKTDLNTGGSTNTELKKDDENFNSDEQDHSWKPALLTQSNSYKTDCVVLQALLNAHHFACGACDGFYGPKTFAAVQAAQKYYKLDADGVCGPLTWAALLKIN